MATTQNSSDWVTYRSAAYLRGKGIDFGAIDSTIFPIEARAIGKYCIGVTPARALAGVVCDDKFSVFANGMFDYVFVRRFIEAVPDPQKLLEDATSKIRLGGHLIVNVPINATGDHIKHRFEPDLVKLLVSNCGTWQMKADIVRDSQILQIYKRLALKPGAIKPPKPRPEKTACIVRYGAFGDMIMITPLLKKLKEDGYHVTVNASVYSASVLENNPNVDNLIPQERDVIFNPKLSDYWKEWEGDYDRYINLSESIEGKLLVVEGRREFYTNSAYRRARAGNINYYDFTMHLGGYPEAIGTKGELFFNHAERKDTKKLREELKDKFLVMWALNGSSHHKMYPLMEPVLRDWLSTHPKAVVITVGDEASSKFEFDHPQILRAAGRMPIRQAMCLTNMADLVVGPESAIINAAGCFDTPKITFLSHSTHENLCKYFTNDYCLTPDTKIAPCYPCHQLHYSRDTCPLAAIQNDQTGEILVSGPTCAMGAIQGDRLISRLNEVYSASRFR